MANQQQSECESQRSDKMGLDKRIRTPKVIRYGSRAKKIHHGVCLFL